MKRRQPQSNLALKIFLLITPLCLTLFAFALSASPITAERLHAPQAVSLISLGSTYSQNFDTLATSGTTNAWTDDTTLPGWYAQFQLTPSNPTVYRADSGGSNTGAIYSWGITGTNPFTERAFGSIASGTPGNIFTALKLSNNTGSPIASLVITYTGEQWRQGGNTSTQKLDFQYQVANTGVITDANSPSTGWIDFDTLDFTSPITGAVAAALDGNAPANQTLKNATLNVAVGNGQEIWLRWMDTNDAGNDHGLAIDNFSVTASGAVLPNLSINDVSLNEGNAGTTNFDFVVSLSAPAPTGGVTFDIATQDNTATQPSDYTQKTLTGQTIPAGSSVYTFTVLVNGDTAPETNETFFVNVTNVTNANISDSQGQGTIVNDDAAPNLTINDVSLNEGNSGTTIFTFTVSLSAPAPGGGVTFDITTLNNTAVSPSDYTTKTLTAQSIPAGSSTYTFTVLANGDTTPEPDETFYVNVTNVTNAIVVDGQGLGTIVNDDLYKIHEVQGSGAASPLVGVNVTVEGVVVANFQGTNKLQGFFLEEEDADWDADPNTSEGVFVFCTTCPTAVAEGQRVKVTGVVSEFNNMTEITASTAGSVVVTDAGNHLAEVTPAAIDLPIVGDVNAFYEAREGMKVTFIDTLTVSEYFELGRYGQIVLYEGGRPRQFTEANAPSVSGNAAQADDLSRRKVILDDDNNAQEWYLTSSSPPGPADGLQYVYYPRANGGFSAGTQGTDFFRGGDLVNGLTGVLHWSFPGFGADTWRIRPTAANVTTFTVANPRPVTPPAVGGTIKAAGMNLLNYFTTIDTTASNSTGPCGPSGTLDCRGADSVAELNRQRERASIVICTVNADVYGFAELENTTPSASITDLLGAVNTRCGGTHPYTYVDTGGTLGTDAIRVEQIYRTGVLSPTIAALVDLDPIHNRPPTAQTYDVVDATNPAFGQRFTVIINHFKSKGSSAGLPGDEDIGDGAGFSNATRSAQATRLLTWITSTVVPAAGDPDVLLLGDFNAYAKEDPIVILQAGGFNDLETTFHGANAYSYLFDGQLGHLDYGLANATLFPQITGADAWHINADEVDLFDYNDEVRDSPGESTFEEKPDGSALVPPRVVYDPGTPYRASDHDPVVVGINLQKTATTTTLTSSQNPSILGQSVTFTAMVTSTGPITPTGTLTFTVDADAPFAQSLVNGSTAFSTSSLSVGSHIITATYGGDLNYLGSTKSGTQNVQYALPTITSMNPNSAPVNAPMFTLVVTGTGFVNGQSVIRWNGVDHTTSFVNDTQLTTTIQKSELAAAGNVTVTVFNPTPGGGEATPALTFTIGQGNTQVTLTQSNNPSVWQQSVTFTATITQTFAQNAIKRPRDIAPGGTVTFTDSTTGSTICGNVATNSWQAMCSTSALTVGLHSIIATFSGDTNYTSSTSAGLAHTVNKADTQTTLVTSLNPSVVGQSVTFTATVGLSGATKPSAKSPSNAGCVYGGMVQFRDGVTNLGSLQPLDVYCRATFTTSSLSVGTHPITVIYSGDNNYNGNTSNQVNQVVNNAKLFMPLINRNFASAPNLVVDNLIVTSNDVQAVIKNIGTQPVVNEFWVDLYINPNTVPTQVNQTWQMLGSQGIVWGVSAKALPINPGETRTLSILNDPNQYYWQSLSNFKLPLTNATVYVQVDSANAGVWYGAALEDHEIAGAAYDNIRKFTIPSGIVTLPVFASSSPRTLGSLPTRPQ